MQHKAVDATTSPIPAIPADSELFRDPEDLMKYPPRPPVPAHTSIHLHATLLKKLNIMIPTIISKDDPRLIITIKMKNMAAWKTIESGKAAITS